MSEEHEGHGLNGLDELDEPEVDRPEPTGQSDVDDVVAAVSGLTDRPLEEHVEVFDEAHARLRRTLDAH